MSGVQSIERAFTVLRCLSAGPAGVTDIAERVELPKSTVSRMLSTLEGVGAVRQTTPGGPYQLGASLLELASIATPATSLVDRARPFLVELTAALGEATGISTLEGRSVHYLAQVANDHAVTVRDWTGQRCPAHTVSSGLVLLAALSKARLDDYLSRPLERATAHTVRSAVELRRRLATARRVGYAWVYEEFQEGINSVAAPIHDSAGRVVAAVHVHGPSYRFPAGSNADEIGVRVNETATRITKSLTPASST